VALLNSDALAIFGNQYFSQRENAAKTKDVHRDADAIGDAMRKTATESPTEYIAGAAPRVEPFPQLLVPGDSYAMQDLLKPSYFEDADARVAQSIW